MNAPLALVHRRYRLRHLLARREAIHCQVIAMVL
jgi:hypothetical protein